MKRRTQSQWTATMTRIRRRRRKKRRSRGGGERAGNQSTDGRGI